MPRPSSAAPAIAPRASSPSPAVPPSEPAPLADQQQELGAFLRAHRETLKPADVGLNATSRRRTPGLRREEAASLSGVGVAWYTWLEQGRVSASRQVLTSIARALRLDDAALRHAMRLAGFHDPSGPSDHGEPGCLAAAVRPVLDSWPVSPAVLVDRHFDMLAWNTPWRVLLGAPETLTTDRRNLMWLMAADPRPRTVLRNWEPLAMNVFQYFRAQAGRSLTDERTAEVYRRLEEDAPHLSHWWGCHSVADLTVRTVTATPPGITPIHLALSSFHPVDDPSALVVLFTPREPADAARMAELCARVGTTV